MASFLASHADTVLLAAVCSAVVLPLLLGVALGHIPRHLFATWALPLATATLLLGAGTLYLERSARTGLRLGVSLLFGLLWLLAGLRSLFFRFPEGAGDAPRIRRVLRPLGWLFLAFGSLWTAVSLYQHPWTRPVP